MALYNDVFNQQIWDFFCSDIESCFEVNKNKQKLKEKSPFKGGMNFTSALAIFSVIEFCAAFYWGKRIKRSEIAVFMNKYFGKYSPVFDSNGKCEKFYDVFRNGLSHQWSPKRAGIAMSFTTKHLIIKHMTVLILNIPTFYEIVICGLKDYETDLNNNKTLCEKFEKRYEEVIRGDFSSASELKSELRLYGSKNAI